MPAATLTPAAPPARKAVPRNRLDTAHETPAVPRNRLRRAAFVTLAALFTAAITAPVAVAASATFSGTSANGAFAFFTTTEQLVPGDTDTRVDVYQRAYDESLERYVTRQVSSGPTGGNDAFTALYDGASADGTRVFFSTDESLVAGDTDHSEDVYVRDLVESATTLVSAGDSGCAGEGCGNKEIDSSFAPGGVVPSGERVFFVSAEQLSPLDGDGSSDVYVRDLVESATILVSRGDPSCAGDGCGNGASHADFHDASDSGAKVLLTTDEKLALGDTDSLVDVYQRDVAGGTTDLVSTQGTCPGSLNCSAVYRGASIDGSHAFFETNEQISLQDEDLFQDVYDWSGGTATLVSTRPAGGNGEFHARFSATSSSGGTAFFETSESLVSADTDSSQDIYERSGGVTSLVSTGPVGGNGPSPASFEWVSPDGSSSSVLFSTDEALTSGDEDTFQDVYERNGGVTSLVSTGPAGGNGEFDARFASASSDGSHVFLVTAEPLVSGDTDAVADVYEVVGETTVLVSTGLVGGKGAFPADLSLGGVAPDGSHAFFETKEQLAVDDLDAETDVYDRFTGGTLLVSIGNSAPLGPPTPSLLSTDPVSPGTTTTPKIKGQAEANTSIKIYKTADCSGAPVATGSSVELGGAGIAVTVASGSTTSFRATATDTHGDTSPCSAPVSYTHQSAPPPPPPPPPPGEEGSGGAGGGTGTGGGSGGSGSKGGSKSYVTPHTRITFAPAGKTRARRPVFRFTDSTGQEGTSFRCKVDRQGWRSCGSPTKLKRLSPGRHVFQVKAVNAAGEAEPTPQKRKFKVVAS